MAPYAASVVYFACLGFGFIAVELALLQNLTLLLGHPIFTLSILLFTLLAAGGLGSAISTLVPPRGACLVVAVLGALEAIALPRLVPAAAAAAAWARVAIADGARRAARIRHGHAVSARSPEHRTRLAAGAAVLSGV